MIQPACDTCRIYAEHARRNTIQAAVILVTLRYGDEAGEWLLAHFEGGTGQELSTALAQCEPPRGTPAMFAEWWAE